APHRAMDVQAWNVDWYFYSAYKVYGPHMGALYGSHDAFDGLPGPNHFFIANDDIPYKFEPGGVSHEGCAALLALGNYLRFLCGGRLEDETPCTRGDVERAFDLMTACETATQAPLMEYLLGRDDITIIGPAHAEPTRVPTISFRHRTLASQEIARRLDPTGIAIRAGHMYAYRLCEALSIPVKDGVVRVSLVHYNTPAEVARLIAELDKALAA
ncbi:MAG: aminotransferase class V-fold PLP-dependent enzyme, partial [Gemmatimonadetes bacterium]|nr:aminotransferase class V-fold PLP-dependent enzyme [Gemmatimonadota bacterium]